MARISRSSARLIRRGKPTCGKSRRKFPGGSRVSSCAGRMVGARWPVVSKSSRAIRIGGSSSSFTNISMAIMVSASAPATRLAGPAWLQNCWSRVGNELVVSRREDSTKVRWPGNPQILYQLHGWIEYTPPIAAYWEERNGNPFFGESCSCRWGNRRAWPCGEPGFLRRRRGGNRHLSPGEGVRGPQKRERRKLRAIGRPPHRRHGRVPRARIGGWDHG